MPISPIISRRFICAPHNMGVARKPLSVRAASCVPLITITIKGEPRVQFRRLRLILAANAEHRTWRLTNNPIGMRPQLSHGFLQSAPPDKDQVGAVLQRLFANHIGYRAHSHANRDVDVRRSLQILDIAPRIFTERFLELMVQLPVRPCLNAGDRVDEPQGCT